MNKGSKSSKESESYARFGASSSKDGVHNALRKASDETEPKTSSADTFVELIPDVSGDSDYYSLLHADGAGTKSIAAYLCYREQNDARWFRGIAQDALVMNLDDVACANAFEGLALSNTIGRNRSVIADDVIAEILIGYKQVVEMLADNGIHIALCGGETADLGDLVRTIVVDSTLFARVRKESVVKCDKAVDGDVLIGISSTGQANYEDSPNSGIASNGLTLGRHALIKRSYAEKYPEIIDPALDLSESYCGESNLFDSPDPLTTTLADAITSPTRTYAPIIKKICEECGPNIHGMFHLTGGGQTKPVRFGSQLRYVKDNLFDCPPVFRLIQSTLNVPWQEMYAVFNMGHRIEIACPESEAHTIIDISSSYGLEAKQIGYVERFENTGNEVQVKSPHGTFEYR
jgi:phosphoribosylformylglycinamidine cyclo-ligase